MEFCKYRKVGETIRVHSFLCFSESGLNKNIKPQKHVFFIVLPLLWGVQETTHVSSGLICTLSGPVGSKPFQTLSGVEPGPKQTSNVCETNLTNHCPKPNFDVNCGVKKSRVSRLSYSQKMSLHSEISGKRQMVLPCSCFPYFWMFCCGVCCLFH